MKPDGMDSQHKAYEVNQIRLQHPNAYKAWTPEEAPKNLREAIVGVIRSRPQASLTQADVARLLIGLGESRRIQRLELSKHPYFGSFPSLHRRDIRHEIENMISAGEVERGTQDGLPPGLKRLKLPSHSLPQERRATPIPRHSPVTARENTPRKSFSGNDTAASYTARNQSSLSLTEDQKRAQEAIFAWCRQKPKQVLTLGGYAGTGKTTVIAETIKRLSKRPHIAFCCYTGKAADILRGKIIKAGAFKGGDYCGTIHGLIYEKIGEDEGDDGKTEILWKKKDSIKADLLVVDEASMVSKEIWNDLSSYGIPILAVGDHGQLSPVGDKYNLMESPDVRLEIIHRQAQESPIVKLSLMARQEGRIPLGQYGPSVVKTQDHEAPWKMKSLDKLMFLCGRNRTRVNLNAQIRERLGIKAPQPIIGDRVICLRNARRFKVFNGMLGLIDSIKASGERWWRVKIKMDSDVLFKGSIFSAQFGQERTLEYEEGQGCLFDWGYALTVHKAQGSEAPRVVLFEERFTQMDDDQWRRWLYTGVTRASQELIVIGN